MPRINIYEQDNTGSSPVADLAIVFVPGTAEIADGKVDANNCVYIPSSATNLAKFFSEGAVTGIHTYGTGTQTINTLHLIEMLIGWGYGVIYKQISSTAQVEATVYTYSVAEVDEDSFANGTYYTLVTALFDIADTYVEGTTYYTHNDDTKTFAPASDVTGENFSDGEYYILKSALYELATKFESGVTYYTREEQKETVTVTGLDTVQDWDFLLDKNAYDIKFVTTGNIGTVPVLEKTDQGYSNVQGTEEYAFKFAVANALLDPITTRKDCALLLDLDYDADKIGLKANTLAKDFKTALEYPKEGEVAEADWRLMKVRSSDNSCVSSRAYTLFTNCEMTYSDSTGDHVLRVPGSFVYLYAYATVNNVAVNWLPISGVTRGVVGEVFTPDIELSKYFLDTQIISDDAGVSFNGLVNIRSYGYTIWGDRTLLEQDAVKKVQATSYFSLRNLVSDIAKTAYNSAIRYTYETNNDVTWLNFKQAIITLLDQMVSSGVLQTYKVNRKPSSDTERNKMIAIIKIYPVLPVENFDVYINLENAELTTTADDIQA